jgi:hypothetical protein
MFGDSGFIEGTGDATLLPDFVRRAALQAPWWLSTTKQARCSLPSCSFAKHGTIVAPGREAGRG